MSSGRYAPASSSAPWIRTRLLPILPPFTASLPSTYSAVISALRESLGKHLKAVLITGDTSSAVKELPRDPFMRIASKPVQADELLTLMRALLAA